MMEMERLINAKECMDRLSNGIDPTSEEVLPKDTILNSVDISRNFFFISDVLRQVIENGGNIARRPQRNSLLPPFNLSAEIRKKIEVTSTPAMIRQFTERINSHVDEKTMQKLKVTTVTSWLVNTGLLCEEVVDDKKRKMPTEEGEKIGIYSEARGSYYGNYKAVLYKDTAQKHIINSLDKIVTLSH